MQVGSEYLERAAEQPVLVTHRLDDESVEDGLFVAFDAIGYDLLEKDPPLNEFLDPGVLDELRAESSDFCLVTSIWGHPVRFTPEEIAIHESSDD